MSTKLNINAIENGSITAVKLADDVWNSVGGGMISITYQELKDKRDSSELSIGSYYRITDYVTTTTQANTASAGHQFDVIVLALSNNELSEEAKAIYHDGDTYFTSANAKLEAWRLWYCLDNDNARFEWADTVNGKGVIYRMIDEYDNDCPYDFKNILSKHPNGKFGNDMFYTFSWINPTGSLSSNILYNACDENGIISKFGKWTDGVELDGAYEWYTYDYDIEDLSLKQTLTNDAGKLCGTHNNIILPWYDNYDSTQPYPQQKLNRNLFIYDPFANGTVITNSAEDGSGLVYSKSITNHFFGCGGNKIGYESRFNTFRNNTSSTIIGDDCYNNDFDDICYSNKLGNECNNIIFKGKNRCNVIGDSSRNITLETQCSYNIFKEACRTITLGTISNNNTFGSNCEDITATRTLQRNVINNYCKTLRFGDSCQNNTIGNYCTNLYVGNNFDNGQIGENCDLIFLGNRFEEIKIGSNCSYITTYNTDNKTFAGVYKNIEIYPSNSYINFRGDKSGGTGFDEPVYILKNIKIVNPIGYGSASTVSVTNPITNEKFKRGNNITFTRDLEYETIYTSDSNGNNVMICSGDIENTWKKTERVKSATTSYSATTSVSATTAKSASTVPFSGIPTGKTSTTVARGDHSHTLTELGLESALKYHGVTTTPLTDGATTKPITIGGVSHHQSAGCVVIYSTTASGDTEFVWNGSSWEKLGDGVNYKVKQNVVSSPSANGNATSFIDTISQDANGVITATKKNITTATSSNFGLMKVGNFLTSNNGTVSVSTGTSSTTVARGDHSHNGYALSSELNDLIEDIEDNEFVTATAFNQINTSAGFTEGGISNLPNQQSLTDAIIDLQENKIGKGDVVDSARTAGIAASINVNDFYNVGSTYPLAILQNSNTGDTSMKTGQLNVAYNNGIKVDSDNSLVSNNGFKGNLYGLAKSATTSVSAQTSNVTKEINVINHDALSFGVYVALVENSYTGDTDYTGSRCIAQDTNLRYQDGVIYGKISTAHTSYSATTSVNAKYVKINEPDWWTRINGCLPVLQSENTGSTPGPNETCYMTVDTGITIHDGQINAQQVTATNVRTSKIISRDSNLEFTDSVQNTRMTLSNSGNLDVAGIVSCSVLSGTGKYYLIGGEFESSTSSKATLMRNSNVYMENGNLYASSDKTLKTHIDNVDGDLEKIKRIPKTIFHWNDDVNKKRQLGTYAQDVEEVYPEIVTKDDNGIRGVAYDRMGVIALAGIDKLYELVQQLQATNKELEKRIKELENKN